MELIKKPVQLGALIGLGGSLLIAFLLFPLAHFDQPIEFIFGVGICWLLYFFLWLGISRIYSEADRKVSWFSNLKKRFFTGLGAMLAFSGLMIVLYNFGTFRMVIYFEAMPDQEAAELIYFKSILDLFFALFLISGLHSISFFNEWKSSEIKTERLQKQNLDSHLATLKDQVSPHFLFNSLNVLSRLVHEDSKLAEKYINRLSLVYRYLMDNKDKEVVSLESELDFMKSYVFLLKVQFGDSLTVDLEVDSEVEMMIPPMAVQMLLENAISHNILAERKPLHINIFITEDNFLAVSNNLQPSSDSSKSTHAGLRKIRQRYEFLTNKEVAITQTQDEFIVKVPLIKNTEQ